MRDLTAVIKTFERPESLDRLVSSIRRFYPDLPIVVADDSHEPRPRDDVEYVCLPPDVGISAGRNALLERVKTPCFLLLDDDFEFTRSTRIERLLDLVASKRVSLAAGSILLCRPRKHWPLRGLARTRLQHYHGTIEHQGDVLTLKRGVRSREQGYYLCDIVLNFFVARTEDVRTMGGWDDELKTTEHEEFFLRFQRHGFRVAYCPDVMLRHWKRHPGGYDTFRKRDYTGLWVRKHGINVLVDMDGRTKIFGTRGQGSGVAPSPITAPPR